jgi:hypothetical protein
MLCGYEDITMQNWIEIASGKYTKSALEYFASCFEDCLMISQVFGSLKIMLDELNMPYIDIYVSAIKFMQDIKFAFRTNIKDIGKKLLPYMLDEASILMEANYVKAYYSARNIEQKLQLLPNALLLCGQNNSDLSLIKDGKMVDFLDYKDDIKELFDKYDSVYYKPHPYSNPSTESEQFVRSLQKVKITTYNFYELMSSEKIKAVAALSSGTLTEAKYFEKNIHYVSHQFVKYVVNAKTARSEDFIIINNECFSPTFWADILSPIVITKDCKYFNFSNHKNLLRASLNTWWGYDLGREFELDANRQLFHLQSNIGSLDNKYMDIDTKVDCIIQRIKPKVGILRRIMAIFVPSKRLRHKILGDNV